jgi:hypothetical protein
MCKKAKSYTKSGIEYYCSRLDSWDYGLNGYFIRLLLKFHLQKFLYVSQLPDNCGDFCLDFTENYLSMERGGIGRHLVFLAIQGCFYWICIALIESRIILQLYTALERLCIDTEGTFEEDENSAGVKTIAWNSANVSFSFSLFSRIR